MYLNTTTLECVTERDIRAANPNTSYSTPFNPGNEYAVVFQSPQPIFDPITQSVREIAPVLTDKGHWEQAWEVISLDVAAIAVNQTAKAVRDREAAKVARTAAVEAITVTTTAGHTFDGDETSQMRMSRAILVLSTGATASVTWVLANNTVIQATAAELTEALALAGAEQARLWVLP